MNYVVPLTSAEEAELGRRVQVEQDSRLSSHIDGFASGVVQVVNGYVYDLDQTTGSQACAYGYNSNGSACATITDPDETKQSCADPDPGAKVCYDINHTKVYSYNLIPGDSGGPVFQIPNPTSLNRIMLGTHVHSVEGNTVPVLGQSGWYTPYGYGRLAYIAHAASGDNYSLCVTASC